MTPRRVQIGSLSEEIERAGGFDEVDAAGRRVPRRTAGRAGAPGSMGWAAKTVLGIAAVAAAVLTIAAVVVRVSVDPADLSAWLAPRVSEALNREITLGETGLALFPRPGVTVSDIRIGVAPGREGPSLASVDRAHFDVSILPLFVGRVDIGRIRLDGASLHLTVDADGTSNFGDWVPTRAGTLVDRPAPVTFGIRSISFSDARLTFFDGLNDRSFAVAGVNGAVHVEPADGGGWRADATADSDSLHLRIARLSEEIVRTVGPTISIVAHGDRSLDWIEIESGAVEQAGRSVDLNGRVEALTQAEPRLDLRFTNRTLDAGILTELIPTTVRSRSLPRTEGSVDAALRFRGTLGSGGGPVLTGIVRLDGVGLRLGGTPLLAEVQGRVVLTADTMRFDSISGRLADGPFDFSGTMRRDRSSSSLVLEASPDLDALDRVGLTPEGMTLAGEATLSVVVVGPLRALDSLDVRGDVRMTGVQVEHERLGVPLYLPAAAFVLDEDGARWSEVTALVGEEPVRSSGRLRGSIAWWAGSGVPEIEASLDGGRLDLDQVLPDRTEGDPPTYSRIAFAHLGGREIDGLRAPTAASRAGLERPESLPARGSLRVEFDEISYRGYELGAVRARLLLGDSVLVVEEAEAEIWDGNVRGSLRLGVGDRLDEPFAFRLHAEGLAAEPFLSRLTPIGDAVTGTLTLDFEVSGTTDPRLLPLLESLDARGSARLTDGSVEGTAINLALADFLASDEWAVVPFSTWVTDFEIEEGMVRVGEANLSGPMANASMSGAIGLGGAVDLAMGLSIPADHLQAVSLRRTGVAQSVLDRLRTTGSPLDLGIRVSGSLEGPTLEPDALAAAESLALRRR